MSQPLPSTHRIAAIPMTKQKPDIDLVENIQGPQLPATQAGFTSVRSQAISGSHLSAITLWIRELGSTYCDTLGSGRASTVDLRRFAM